MKGDIFIYSWSGQLISFEIDSISKEMNRVEHEYMNMSLPLIGLATPLDEDLQRSCYISVQKLLTSCVRTACSKLLELVWNELLTYLFSFVGTPRKFIIATCNNLDVNNLVVNNLQQFGWHYQTCYKVVLTRLI